MKPSSFDLYRRIPADLLNSSAFSARLSMVTMCLLTLLFLAETWNFFQPVLTTTTALNDGDEKIRINFNITMLDMSCDFAEVDVQDILGTDLHDVQRFIDRYSITDDGDRVRYTTGGKGGGIQREKVQSKVVLHDHDEDGNNKHGTHEELLEDGEHVTVLEDGEALTKQVKSQDFVFVDFYAPWCSWCQRLDPTWEKFAEEVQELSTMKGKESFKKFTIAKIDCAANPHDCGENNIRAFPTLRLFYKGEKWGGDYKGDRTLEGFRAHLNAAFLDKAKVPIGKKKEDNGLNFAKTGKNSGVLNKLSKNNPDWHATDHSGCELSGYLKVNRVPGTLFIEARSDFQDVLPNMQNVSHVVNELSFGMPLNKYKTMKLKSTPEEYRTTAALDGKSFITEKLHSSHHHNLDIVHMRYVKERKFIFGLMDLSDDIFFYQYLTQSQLILQAEDDVPEARFTYDVSPLCTTLWKKSKPWFEYLCSLSAILGGTFSLMKFASLGVKEKRF